MDESPSQFVSTETEVRGDLPRAWLGRFRRPDLRRIAAVAGIVVIVLLPLRELGVLELSLGWFRSNSTVNTLTSPQQDSAPTDVKTIVLNATSLVDGAGADALIERLNGDRLPESYRGQLVGSIDAQLTQLEIKGNSWLPLRKSLHAEFSLAARIVLGSPDRSPSRAVQSMISGSFDMVLNGFYSSRDARRAVGKAIADAVLRQIGSQMAEAAKAAAQAPR